MKKYIVYVLLGMALMSCTEVLDREFNNPEQYNPDSEVLPSGLFTKTLYDNKIFVQDYGEWWWQLTGMSVTAYSQIGVRVPVSAYASIYNTWEDVKTGSGFTDNNCVRSYFNDIYKRLNAWALLKGMMEEGNESFRNDAFIYYQLVTLIKEVCVLRNVDFFNSIPYSEAFRGVDGIFFPKYDDPKEIYISALNSIAALSKDLPLQHAKMSESAKKVFVAQDLAFKGDITKWVQYANAVRLKYAVRLSGVDETTAKEHIKEVLEQNNLPVSDLTWQLPFSPNDALPGGGTWNRGLFERFTSFFIPNVLMKRMNYGALAYEDGVDDPRLPVLASATKFGDYRGIRMNQNDYQKQWDSLSNIGERFIYNLSPLNVEKQVEVNSVSAYNFITFVRNDFPVYMMSLGEVDLFLAEVAAKGLGNTGKTAGEHLSDAVVHSTDFWYYVNGLSNYSPGNLAILRPKKPASAVVATFAAKVKALYNTQSGIENQMEVIMQQKYIHMNIMGSYELWADLRRTRHPKLEPVTFGTYSMAKPQPERARYPDSEQVDNSANYAKVEKYNNFTSPIFWVPESKVNESYYRDSYIP